MQPDPTACWKKNWVRMLAVFLLGGLGSLALPPFPVWMLPFLVISLSSFWIILTGFEKKWHWPLAGFLYGFGYFLGGIWWVGNALLVGGNPFLWALPLAVCGLQALLALFPMMAALMSQWFYRGRGVGAYAFFLAMMGFWEWGRGHFFTGFPWNLFGMAWTYSLPMLQTLSLGGIYLLSLLTLFLCTLPGFLVSGQSDRVIKAALLVAALVLGVSAWTYGSRRLESHPTDYDRDVVVQVVSPNIAQADKWQPELFWVNFIRTVDAIATPPNQSLTGKTRVIILPETALHYAHLEDPNARLKLEAALKPYPERTYLLSGFLRRAAGPDGSETYHNSLVGFDTSLTEVMTFDKFHLVPFGEYMPLQQYIPIGPVIGFSGFESGKGPETEILPGLPPFSPLVCYEVIFPGAVTAEDEKGYAPRPRWMVNVTNDAWYGVSPGPYQHLGQAIYRAIEEGLPMIRSTNTGFSAIIDPLGRVLDQNQLFATTSQISYLPAPLSGPTLFSSIKDRLFFLITFILFLPFLCKLVRKNPSTRLADLKE